MSYLCRRFTVSAVSAFLFVMCGAAAQADWVKTNTQAIPLAQARSIGAVDPASQMRISVALQIQNAAALRNLVQQQSTIGSPYYNTVITPAQFNATYAPGTAAVVKVQNYLAQMGFSNISVEPNRLFIIATGTAAQVEAAFNTSLSWFSQNGKNVFVNTVPAQVPAALGGIVLSVLGLNNVASTTPHTTPCSISTPTCVRRSYDPATYWKTYDVGTVSTGSATSVAVMAEGDVTQTIADLRTFESAMGLPVVPVIVTQVGPQSSDTVGVEEFDLDTQYTTGMAGNVNTLYIYTASGLTDQDLSLDFSRWASDDLAQVANASFGICEVFSFLDGAMVADDQVFLEAAAQGQTLFSSAGDSGSFCNVEGVPPNGVPGGAPFVSYPAASSFVVGVGGTTLLSNADGSYNGEIAWDAGGGGISQFELSPTWQQGIVPTNSPSAPMNFRALPDVSMDADPDTGAIIYFNGQKTIIGGTSLASPLAVGVWARLETACGNKLGFAPPRLYARYPVFGTPPGTTGTLTQLVDGFHDVLTGSNGLFTSLPFYDFTTGLGTFDVAQKRTVIPQ